MTVFAFPFVGGATIFTMWVTARPGVGHEALEAALFAEVDRLAAEGPSDDELERVRNLHAANVESSLERVGERADRLSMYACLFDQPERVNSEVSRYLAVDAGARPRGDGGQHPPRQPRRPHLPPGRGPGGRRMTATVNPMRPPAGAPRALPLPAVHASCAAERPDLWLVPVTGSSLVNVHLLLDAGAAAEDEAHGGVAALTAQLMVTGTRRLDASAFAEATERLGIEVSSESSWDSARAAFQALPQHMDAGLALLGEMIQEPRFDPGEFERLKAERLADILQARAEPGRLADEHFLRNAYDADTPYRRLAAGTPETVEPLVRDDVVGFHGAPLPPRIGAPGRRRLVRPRRGDRLGRAPPRRLERDGARPPHLRAARRRAAAGW